MEINELRIGNRVEQGIVHSIGYNMGHSGYYGVYVLEHEFSSGPSKFIKIDEVKPIQLTEQLLLDFMFEKVDTKTGPPINEVWDSFEKEPLKITKYVDFDNKGWMLEDVCGIFTPEIKYVHQLQNLYFTLTGEELINQ